MGFCCNFNCLKKKEIALPSKASDRETFDKYLEEMNRSQPFNKSAAIDRSFWEYLNEDWIDVGTGREVEDANDTEFCQGLQIRQMHQSTWSPG